MTFIPVIDSNVHTFIPQFSYLDFFYIVEIKQSFMPFHYRLILMGIKYQLKISIVKSYLWGIWRVTAVYDSISFYSFLWDVGNFSLQEKMSKAYTKSDKYRINYVKEREIQSQHWNASWCETICTTLAFMFVFFFSLIEWFNKLVFILRQSKRALAHVLALYHRKLFASMYFRKKQEQTVHSCFLNFWFFQYKRAAEFSFLFKHV